MRVLFTAAPEVGHIAPMLGVAAAARDAGHDVVIATHPSRHGLIARAGLEPVAAGLSGEDVIRERLRRWPDTRSLPATVWGVRMWVHIAAPAMAADVRAIIDRRRPDVVVHEEGEYGGPVAAAAAGLPWVTHGWGAPMRPTSELEAVEVEARDAGLWETQGLAPARFGGLYGHAFIDPCPALLDPHRSAVCPTSPVRPTVLGSSSPIPPIPPVSPAGPSARRCYIGFGTVPTFANAADAITIAAEAAASAGLDVLATLSDAALARTLRGLGVDVRTFVALPDVLRDCSLVVTHGGAGTTLAALSYGVPVVAVPQGAPSQERMAAAVERAGVGRHVRDGEALADAVVAAATDTGLADRAAAAARTIAAMPAPETCLGLLERLGRHAGP